MTSTVYIKATKAMLVLLTLSREVDLNSTGMREKSYTTRAVNSLLQRPEKWGYEHLTSPA